MRTQDVAGSRDPSHLPTSPCVSQLPNSSSVTYFSTWRVDSQRGWRPAPPTPGHGRMAPEARDRESLAPKKVQRLSVSSIPHPASGTSRREISVRKASNPSLTASPLRLSSERARRPSQRRSVGTKSDNTYSSYHLPRVVPPIAESILKQDDFGTMYNAFANSTPFRGSHGELSNSQTLPAILPSHHDVTLQCLPHLMEPTTTFSSTYSESASPGDGSSIMSPIVSPSVNDILHQKRLRKQNVSSRPLRPGLAKSQTLSILTSSHANGEFIASSKYEIESRRLDPRYVFVNEPPQYWSGRYTTLVDRLRTDRLIPPLRTAAGTGLASKESSSGPKSSAEFDRAEWDIRRETVKILNSFCETEEATKGFRLFESYLSDRHSDHSERQIGSRDGDSNMLNANTKKPQRALYPPINPAKPKVRKLSDALPNNIFRKGSAVSSSAHFPKVSKSSTIANFSLASSESFGNQASSEGPQQQQKAMAYNTKKSDQLQVSGPTACAVPDRRSRPVFANTKLEQATSSTISEHDSPQIRVRPLTMPLSTSMSSIKLNSDTPAKTSQTSSKHDPRDAVREGLMQQQENPGTDHGLISVTAHDTPHGHSRRFRKSESMKRLVDAGLREIRKISHRVSTTGGHSGEDF